MKSQDKLTENEHNRPDLDATELAQYKVYSFLLWILSFNECRANKSLKG